MIKLKIPSADGGEEEGLNDPGVEFFLGSIEHHLARESAQNTIDAAAQPNVPVNLGFDLLSVPRAEIPCVDPLIDVLKRCQDFWRSNRKPEEFFKAALQLLQGPSVNILRVSDCNTTGLTGSDIDRSGRWYGLVRSAGVSNKDEGAGGSYGIGKYAPFAASQLRTVFYSTRTVTGEVAFQGIMRLASHKDENGRITRRTGYIGAYSEQTHSCTAVRQNNLIPSRFQRSEAGTDIFIIGYRNDLGWEQHLLSSIVANFWPAIHRGIVTFRVGDKELNSASLSATLAEFSSEDDFEAHFYHRALVDGHRHEATIKNLGKVTLFLLADGDDLPKRVALTRKTGMIIDLKMFRSRRPFTGYLICDDPVGNELLRSMEPPRHDEWNPKRGTAVAAKALRDLYDWIRGRIKELNPVPTAQALDVPDLARYLPFEEEADQQAPSASDAPPDSEMQFTPVTPQRQIEMRPAAASKPRILENTNEGGERGGKGGSGSDEGGSGGGGGGNGGDDGVSADAGGGAGQKPSRTPVMKPRLRLRSFMRNDGTYELVVRSLAGDATGFRLIAVGEDGQTEAPPVKAARDAVSKSPLHVNSSRITATVTPKRPAHVVVEFQTPLRLALSVEAI